MAAQGRPFDGKGIGNSAVSASALFDHLDRCQLS
jgi:hypothetical protein